MASDKKTNLVWMDLEMTGLDSNTEEIIEIATIITDKELNVIKVGPDVVIHQDESRFDKMDDWNKNQHTKSGLWKQVVDSKITISEAEKITLEFIKQHVDERVSPLCGNSIWQDRRFIANDMKTLDEYLHYRIIDVSTIKELTTRWYDENHLYTGKKGSHRALDDIEESIAELKHFRKTVFKDK